MRHASIEVLSSYLDGELAGRKRRRVELHLQECEQCQHRLDGLHGVVQRLEWMKRISPAPYLEKQVLQGVTAQARRESLMDRLEKAAGRLHIERWVWMPTFGMVIALVSIIYLFSWGLHRQQQGLPVVLDAEIPEVETSEVAKAPATGRESRPEAELVAEVTQPERQAVGLADTTLESRAESSGMLRDDLILADSMGESSGSRATVIGGRTFDLRDGLWIERGLDPSVPPTISLDPAEVSASSWREQMPSISELERLGGPVRLRVGDQLIQVEFGTSK